MGSQPQQTRRQWRSRTRLLRLWRPLRSPTYYPRWWWNRTTPIGATDHASTILPALRPAFTGGESPKGGSRTESLHQGGGSSRHKEFPRTTSGDQPRLRMMSPSLAGPQPGWPLRPVTQACSRALRASPTCTRCSAIPFRRYPRGVHVSHDPVTGKLPLVGTTPSRGAYAPPAPSDSRSSGGIRTHTPGFRAPSATVTEPKTCRRRESDPLLSLGKAVSYRQTPPARG